MPRTSDKYHGNTPFPAEMIVYVGLGGVIMCLASAFIQYSNAEEDKPIFAISQKPNKLSKTQQQKELKENQLEKMSRKPETWGFFGCQWIKVAIYWYLGMFFNQTV